MNRLWVWISAVIVVVVLFVVLFPFGYRMLTGQPFGAPRPPEQIPSGEFDPERFREQAERRFWDNLARTLAISAVIGLIAGALLARWLVSPLRQMEEGVKAVEQQQLDYRMPVKGSQEMRSVASSFNQMAEKLEHQEELRRNLLADVTHELRHPVHILQGNLQAILDGVYPLSMDEIDRMLEQTHNLISLVDDLHELALAEAHELPLHKRAIDLVALVSDTSSLFQILADEKGVKLDVQLPGEALIVTVDPDRVRQALGNLLGNALRYTPEGGSIEVMLEIASRTCQIRIRDSGIGISAEDLPKVFDRFYRLDPSRSRDLPGAGLGLSIAQAIIQSHSGSITAESGGRGQGSTFTILLPLSESI